MTIGELVTKAVIERNNIFHIDLANDMEVDITVDKDFTSSDIIDVPMIEVIQYKLDQVM